VRLEDYLNADWKRFCELSERNVVRRWFHLFNPRFLPVCLIRIAYVLNQKGFVRIAKLFSFLNFFLFNIEVPVSLKIGPGLVVPHPQGTVLGAKEIGENVTIFHQVTLGAKKADFEYDLSTRPLISNNVTLSVGSKVLGSVIVGEGAIVGANSVVLEDVPSEALAVGIPAKIIQKNVNYDK